MRRALPKQLQRINRPDGPDDGVMAAAQKAVENAIAVTNCVASGEKSMEELSLTRDHLMKCRDDVAELGILAGRLIDYFRGIEMMLSCATLRIEDIASVLPDDGLDEYRAVCKRLQELEKTDPLEWAVLRKKLREDEDLRRWEAVRNFDPAVEAKLFATAEEVPDWEPWLYGPAVPTESPKISSMQSLVELCLQLLSGKTKRVWDEDGRVLQLEKRKKKRKATRALTDQRRKLIRRFRTAVSQVASREIAEQALDVLFGRKKRRVPA